MLSYSLYKVVHLLGLMLLMAALGGIALHSINGGTRATNRSRKLVAAMHGVGAFLILLGGFGMLARLNIVQTHTFPAWLWTKIGIWVALGAAILLPYRGSSMARAVLIALPVLGGVAAYMAIYKPW